MAASAVHKKKWEHNRQFLTTALANNQDHPDWILISAFYTALHAVESVLAIDKHHPDSHRKRHEILAATPRYQKIWEHYHTLYNGAWVARYDCAVAFTYEKVREEFVKKCFQPIERSVCTLLGSGAPAFPVLVA